MLFSECHKHTPRKKLRVLITGLDPKTFQLVPQTLTTKLWETRCKLSHLSPWWQCSCILREWKYRYVILIRNYDMNEDSQF